MFILENTIKLKNIILGLSLASAALLVTTGCSNESDIKLTNSTKSAPIEKAVDGAVEYKVKKGMYTEYHVNTNVVGKKYDYFRPVTKNEIAAWNVDVMPDGTGAPMYDTKNGKVVLDKNGKPKIAQGTAGWGNDIYDKQCGMCHGDFGAGGKGYPVLSGGSKASLKNQLMNPADKNPGIEPPKKTIGSYWPYVSTLFWYIQDSMPFPHPKSLTNSETYALVAYLLLENGYQYNGEDIDDDFVMNRDKFVKIVMHNHDGFYPQVDTPKNPKQGVENMTKFLSNPKNYGTGTRCMKDCVKGDVSKLVMHIKQELNDFKPAASTVRDLPAKKETAAASPGKALYDANGCAGCHENAAIGAPVLGDKAAWAEVTKDGIDKVYQNGINGINAMPPKGGTNLSDKDFKTIVDFMIKASK